MLPSDIFDALGPLLVVGLDPKRAVLVREWDTVDRDAVLARIQAVLAQSNITFGWVQSEEATPQTHMILATPHGTSLELGWRFVAELLDKERAMRVRVHTPADDLVAHSVWSK